MTTPLDSRNALAQEMLVACDQAYVYDLAKNKAVSEGTPIGPLADSPPADDAPLPYALPDPGFKVIQVIDEPTTGFKALIYRHESRNEVIVAMAGTDGPNLQDWAQNLRWGWGQWDFNDKTGRLSVDSGKSLIRKALEPFSDPARPPTTIHFTGQSLGGALAEYAAFDYWQENSTKQPNLLQRITLTTFNGLAGGAGLTKYGLVSAAELAGFAPSRTAHYEVSNDLVNRLGGNHLAAAGNLYRLDFRSERSDPSSGERLLLHPVDAHRIESGFYRPFAKQVAKGDTRFFDQAIPNTDWRPFPTDGLQSEPGRLIALFNSNRITETSGKQRAIAGLIVALNSVSTSKDLDALLKPVLDAFVRADLTPLDEASGAALPFKTWVNQLALGVAQHLSNEAILDIASQAKVEAVNRLLTALVIEALATPEKRPDVERLNTLLPGISDPEVTAWVGAIREKAEATGSGTVYSYEIKSTGYQVGAGSGSDRVYAGAGNDVVFSANDDDFLLLEDGDDRAWGGSGADFLVGGGGRDFLVGDGRADETGDDTLDGGDEDDVLFGGAGEDVLLGGAGNDHLWGDGGSGFALGAWTVTRQIEEKAGLTQCSQRIRTWSYAILVSM